MKVLLCCVVAALALTGLAILVGKFIAECSEYKSATKKR